MAKANTQGTRSEVFANFPATAPLDDHLIRLDDTVESSHVVWKLTDNVAYSHVPSNKERTRGVAESIWRQADGSECHSGMPLVQRPTGTMRVKVMQKHPSTRRTASLCSFWSRKRGNRVIVHKDDVSSCDPGGNGSG